MEEKPLDVEIALMESISQIMDHYIQNGLDPEARYRVIEWIRRRYGEY